MLVDSHLNQPIQNWVYGEKQTQESPNATEIDSSFHFDGLEQSIRLVGSESGTNGISKSMVSVKTEFIRDVQLTDNTLVRLNASSMLLPSMAGPVYNAKQKTISLYSLVRISEFNASWVWRLVRMSALLQLSEAERLSRILATPACSKQWAGIRWKIPEKSTADRRKRWLESAEGHRTPCINERPNQEIKAIVEGHSRRPGASYCKSDAHGFVVEFKHSDYSSICKVQTDYIHQRHGSGVKLDQLFPEIDLPKVEGIKLALSLNARELVFRPSLYGIGSYAYRNGVMRFSGFFPDEVYSPGLVESLYSSCSDRANTVSNFLSRVMTQ